MGWSPWATPKQAVFLESFVDQLEEEKHNHGLAPFYARVMQEFIQHWESPIPDKVDKKITDPAELKRLADERRGCVS